MQYQSLSYILVAMKYSLDHLLSFIHVYETSSFTAAAKRLNMSKAIISQHIKALEQYLSAQLVHRTTRKLMFTDAGIEFYQKLCPLFEKIHSAIDTVQSHTHVAKGDLRIILNANLARAIRITMLPDFLSRHPEVSIRLVITEDPRDHIDGEFDILIFPVVEGTTLPNIPLVAKPLFNMPVGIYATKTYLKKHGTPKQPSDLKKHNCIAPFSGNHWPFKSKEGEVYFMETKGNLSANHDEVFRSMVLNDQAIGYAYPRLFTEELKNGDVISLLETNLNLTVDIHALYHQSYYTPMKIKIFLEEIQRFYEKEQGVISKSKKNSKK